MAKTVCEDWANLLLNEKVSLRFSDENAKEIVDNILYDNNFYVNANRLIELSYALGTGAFLEYIENGEVKIDYIKGNMIYPLSWENGKIINCAFASEKMIGHSRYVYLNLHIKQNGKYVIYNRLLKEEKENRHFHVWIMPRHKWMIEKFGNR